MISYSVHKKTFFRLKTGNSNQQMDLTVENGCISITGVLKKHLYNALLKIVLYFSCRSFLKKYILDINPLSDI